MNKCEYRSIIAKSISRPRGGFHEYPASTRAPGWVLFVGLTGRIPSPSGCFRAVSCDARPFLRIPFLRLAQVARSPAREGRMSFVVPSHTTTTPADTRYFPLPFFLLPEIPFRFIAHHDDGAARRVCLSSEITRSCRGPAEPSATRLYSCSLPTLK